MAATTIGIAPFTLVGTKWNTTGGVEARTFTSGHTASIDIHIEAGGGTVSLQGYAPGANRGISAISVDGGPEVLVDLYGTQSYPLTTYWTSGPLAEGLHSVVLRNTGTKNPSATSTYATLTGASTTNGTFHTPGTYVPPPPPASSPWTVVENGVEVEIDLLGMVISGQLVNLEFIGQGAPIYQGVYIFDTDMATDVDDLLAVRLMGNYVKSGAGQCIAAVVTTRSYEAVKTTRYMLDTEGMSGVPLGRTSSLYADRTTKGAWHSEFSSVWTMTDADVDAMPDAVPVLRQALANVADNSVDYQVVGHLGAVYALLESPGDAIDPRDGTSLFLTKVKHLWVMGGNYPSGSEHNFAVTAKAAEAASYVFSSGLLESLPVTLLGFSVGDGVQTGQFLPSTDIVRQAFIAHGSSTGRSSWDPMLIELASSGGDLLSNGYSSVQGTVNVAADGSNTFTVDSNGTHRYLTMVWTDQQFEDYLNPRCHPDFDEAPEVIDPVTGMTHLLRPPTTYTENQVVTSIGEWTKAPDATSDVVLQTKDGKPSFFFDGASWLTTTELTLGTQYTIYASFWMDSFDRATGKQTIVAMDGGGIDYGANGRNWHMPISITGEYVPATFSGSSGADHPTGLAAVVGAWNVMTLVRDGDTMTVYLNGASATFTRVGINSVAIPLTVGGRSQGGGFDDQIVGWVPEVRVYPAVHTPAEVAAVEAALA